VFALLLELCFHYSNFICKKQVQKGTKALILDTKRTGLPAIAFDFGIGGMLQ
jgi:hypothetical protein